MAMRAWTVWGIGATLVGGLAVSAKPPELPGKPQVDGKVPPPLTQDYFQVQAAPPRLLPPAILDPKPLLGPETAGESPEVIAVGLRAGAATAHWMTLLTFARAESHFDACEIDDARRWYQAVIQRAPGSRYARIAQERLLFGKVIPAGRTQSREPPLADPAGLPRPIPATANGPID
jgi:hypothetical protein